MKRVGELNISCRGFNGIGVAVVAGRSRVKWAVVGSAVEKERYLHRLVVAIGCRWGDKRSKTLQSHVVVVDCGWSE